jgi:uncharacterized protein (TIGR04141 family)
MKTHGLTIYLIKEGLTRPIDVIKPDISIRYKAVDIDEYRTFSLFVRPVPLKHPSWTTFFSSHVEPAFFGEVSSSGAVLIVPAANRLFAIAFGQGRFLLIDDCWEERFGLKVVLNSIKGDRLRSIDKQTFDAFQKLAREQVSRNASAFDFGFDIERDLLRAVTGVPEDVENLGQILTGMDALKAHLPVEISNVDEPLTRFFGKHLEASYKEEFEWVDYIAAVKSKETIAILDLLLLDRLRGSAPERCWLAAPNIVDWSFVRGFKYSPSGLVHHDIHLATFFDTLDEPVSRELLNRRRIFCIGDDDQIKDDWPVYRCLYCEIDDGAESYLLSGGKWYQVAQKFVERVNESFVSMAKIDLGLPEYHEDKSETAYLKRISAHQEDFALMDGKNIPRGLAYSKVEFCDLLSRSKDIIHVKRYGDAGVLSHLFAQGSVSADLMIGDSEFREKVRAYLPPTHIELVPISRPRPSEYRVVFAVISQSPQPLTFPFFSRLSLRHAVRRLETLGFKVALAKIEVSETTRLLQTKVPTAPKKPRRKRGRR